MSNIESGTQIYLRDNQENTLTKMQLNQEISFNSGIADNSTRFSLLFKSPSATTNSNAVNQQLLRVYKNDQQRIILENNMQIVNGIAYVYNTVGQLMEQVQLKGNISSSRLIYQAGTYIVHANINGEKIIQKLVISNF